MEDNKSWLKSCPASDGNFKSHLSQASIQELQELIAELPEKHNKSKIQKLKAELNRRTK